AIFDVFDEESPPAAPGMNRPGLSDSELSLILGSSASTTTSPGSREGQATSGGTQFLSDGWIRNLGSDSASVDLYYTPDGAQGITDPHVKKNTVTVPGYSSYRLTDF